MIVYSILSFCISFYECSKQSATLCCMLVYGAPCHFVLHSATFCHFVMHPVIVYHILSFRVALYHSTQHSVTLHASITVCSILSFCILSLYTTNYHFALYSLTVNSIRSFSIAILSVCAAASQFAQHSVIAHSSVPF